MVGEQLVALVKTASSVAAPLHGGLRSDGMALVFSDVASAVKFGTSLYQKAFAQSTVVQPRLWMRGVIVPLPDEETQLSERRPLNGALPFIEVDRLSDALLTAINVEQSGFKGARLIVDSSLVTAPVRAALVFLVFPNARPFYRLKKMRSSRYPRVAPSRGPIPTAEGAGVGPYQDVLWMVPEPLGLWSDWEAQAQRMNKFMRGAASRADAAEIEQVAATLSLFPEVEAILQSLQDNR